MAISLSKGGNVNLSKEAPGINKMIIGLGWNPRVTDGQEFDLDAVAFLLTDAGKVGSDSDFIFFNNKAAADGSVTHTGDNRTGDGDGDDEQLIVDVSKIRADVTKIVFCVTIHQGIEKKQNFGQVSGAFIRVVNDADQKEVARYDLSEDSSTDTASIFGELYKHNGEWKFRAVGQGFNGGLAPLAVSYGVAI